MAHRKIFSASVLKIGQFFPKLKQEDFQPNPFRPVICDCEICTMLHSYLSVTSETGVRGVRVHISQILAYYRDAIPGFTYQVLFIYWIQMSGLCTMYFLQSCFEKSFQTLRHLGGQECACIII